jgi:LmbE family N-acetylglucosaminyl deacetylase
MSKQNKLMVIGAHADDCEKVGGIALKFKKAGGGVKYLCATNGCSGHHQVMGGALVHKRMDEAKKVATLTGIEYDFLDIDDGFLTAGLHERSLVLKAIREYAPTAIITHRPNDYHPDHRNTSQLVQDCSYLVQVPNVCPMTPVLHYMPAIFYMPDNFKKPFPFTADLVFDISDEFDMKMRMYHQYDSQMYEWLPFVGGADMSAIPQDDEGRFNWLKETRFNMSKHWAVEWRDKLVEKYGEKAQEIKYAEALECCEYGGRLSGERLREVFPF